MSYGGSSYGGASYGGGSTLGGAAPVEPDVLFDAASRTRNFKARTRTVTFQAPQSSTRTQGAQ